MIKLLELKVQSQGTLLTKQILFKNSWSLLIEEISPDFDSELVKLILEGHTAACLESLGIRKPTLKHANNIACFREEVLLIFHISDFIRLMSEMKNRWEKVEWTLKKLLKAYCHLHILIITHQWELLPQNYQDWKNSHEKITFSEKLSQLHRTKYPDLFVIYRESFIVNSGNKHPVVVNGDPSVFWKSISSPLIFESVEKMIFSSTEWFN